jgi:2-(1,2-epoxy-1,2-dihydrophenyl)acetyl-CoA isomerase
MRFLHNGCGPDREGEDAMTHQYKSARFDIDGDGIARFTMCKPEILNPLTDDLRDDFEAMVNTVEGNPDVKVLILAGEGRAFSAGGNVKGMAERKDAQAAQARTRLYDAHNWLQRLYNIDCPVIAAVDGLAFGGGFAFALVADFIFASEKARFCSVFGRIGLMPDLGVLYTLPRVVGMAAAKDLMFTCRSIDVEEAKALGIVHQIHRSETLMGAVDDFAARLAQSSKDAIAITKRTVNGAFESTYGDVVDAEANGQAVMFTTPFHKEAVRRFIAKEPSLYDWDRMTK